jgi:uncharacterized protein with gpF-like domain
MRHKSADKSQINRRPYFLPSTLGADIDKYNLQKRGVLTYLGLDNTDIRARISHTGANGIAFRGDDPTSRGF